MRVVIHQPYFLPWLGYFSKLAYCDLFVVLDDVLFRKRHFIDRTRIVNMHGDLQWIGVPVGQNFGVMCRDICFANPAHADILIRTLACSYAKAEHYDREFPTFADMLRSAFCQHSTLVELDVALLTGILQLLMNRRIPIVMSSTMQTPNEPTGRVLSICRQTGATEIVIGTGKSLHVHDWHAITENGISVFRQDYLSVHPVYRQVRRQRLSFAPGLSVVDALLNVGRGETVRFICGAKYRPAHFLPAHRQRGV